MCVFLKLKCIFIHLNICPAGIFTIFYTFLDEEEEEEIPKKKFKREKQNMSDIFAHTNADIRSWIECPICMITPRRGYIYQCYNGHVTCSTCYQRLKQDHNRCPECNEPYQRDKDNRCLMAEKIRDGYVLYNIGPNHLVQTVLQAFKSNCGNILDLDSLIFCVS